MSTYTSLGLTEGQKFLGAYITDINNSIGFAVNPSTCSVTLVEDDDAIFETPVLGSFHRISLGSSWYFDGIVTNHSRDIKNAAGRTIQVNMADAREIMKSVTMILAPGCQNIVDELGSRCAVMDVYGAYFISSENSTLNLSGWNGTGMEVTRILAALKGENIQFGTIDFNVPKLLANIYGEIYSFDFTELETYVNAGYRVNSNLISLAEFVDDLAQRNAFEWYIEAERNSSNQVVVTCRVINRRTDNEDISLEVFANLHENVVSISSGLELRNDLNCTVLQGAFKEGLSKVDIAGLANEPVDLSPEGGSEAYYMTEGEMRAVLGGRTSWEVWLSIPGANGGGEGFDRYGGTLESSFVNPIVKVRTLINDLTTGKIKNADRTKAYLSSANFGKVGLVFEKLRSHAEETYGKRWVHGSVLDEIIDSAWTQDIVAGNNNPNEYFRQEDGRTRCYVEFSNDQGGAFTLGLGDLTNIFPNVDLFTNVIAFGGTFSNFMTGSEIIPCELAGNFTVANSILDTDKSNYIYDEGTTKSKLFVAATIDKDGVVRIDAPVLEQAPSKVDMVNKIIQANVSSSAAHTDADGNTVSNDSYIKNMLSRFYGINPFRFFARCHQPKFAYIPTRSRLFRYGPVYSQYIERDFSGKLEIIQDDSFAPWEFGSTALMTQVMQLKVDLSSSAIFNVQTGNVVVEGYPLRRIGDAIGFNSNISSIQFTVSGGAKTTYGLQSYTKKFGELSNDELTRLTIVSLRRGNKITPENIASYIDTYSVKVNKQFTGRGNKGAGGLTGGAYGFE